MKLSDLLNSLGTVNSIVSLVLQIGAAAVPLGAGLITAIKAMRTNQDGSVEYQILITVGKDKLNSVIAKNDAVVERVNAELVRLGKPPLTT